MIKQKILFNCNFEYMQCNKVFEITGAIKNSSREKSKKLLGLEVWKCHTGIGNFIYYKKMS